VEGARLYARQRNYQAPENVWRRPGSPQITQDAGREWLIEGSALALVVPSVIVPREANVVLNARHPQFSRVRISKPEPFSLDQRLWK
jgi:RES domain-containing protein